jgi:RNA polymerase sigma-70 factor (ECF subfamily)
MNNDEYKIIKGIKQGENWAYRHLYDHHYVLLCKIAISFLHDVFLAQTIVDDLIINLYEKRETLHITTSLRAYLVRSLRNNCISYLQSEQKKKVINFSSLNCSENWLTTIADFDDYPFATLLEQELEQEINSSVGRLPDVCRVAFEKSRFEGKNYEIIAMEMNISINTVKYHIKNALLHLRKDLGKYLLLILSYLVFF